jgi:hypothetical protein
VQPIVAALLATGADPYEVVKLTLGTDGMTATELLAVMEALGVKRLAVLAALEATGACPEWHQEFETHAHGLAASFAGVLRSWLSPGKMKAVLRLNRGETDPGICHSHDYCDANMAMLEALEGALGRPMELSQEVEMALFNRAWGIAKDHGFSARGIRAAAQRWASG